MCCTLVYTLFCQLYFFVRDIHIVHLFYLIRRPYRTRVFVILGFCVSEPLDGRIQFYTPIDRSTSFLEDSLRCPCAYCVVRWSVFGKRVHGIRKIAATHPVVALIDVLTCSCSARDNQKLAAPLFLVDYALHAPSPCPWWKIVIFVRSKLDLLLLFPVDAFRLLPVTAH